MLGVGEDIQVGGYDPAVLEPGVLGVGDDLLADNSDASSRGASASTLEPGVLGVGEDIQVGGGSQLEDGVIQMKSTDAATGHDTDTVQRIAADGVAGSGGQLPHLDTIQAAFGKHDVGGIKAHTGGKAADAAGAIGAEAYATGDSVAFASAPDLHTAAHEAAHVLQQRSGAVQLKSGVGQAGDAYEQHADAVADAVVRAESAESLLDGNPEAASPTNSVQRQRNHGRSAKAKQRVFGAEPSILPYQPRSPLGYQDVTAGEQRSSIHGIVTFTATFGHNGSPDELGLPSPLPVFDGEFNPGNSTNLMVQSQGDNQVATGFEIESFHRWQPAQAELAGSITDIVAPIMFHLRDQGVLDEQLKLRRPKDVLALFQRVEQLGRSDSYSLHDQHGHAAQLNRGAADIEASTVAYGQHRLKIREYQGSLVVLSQQLQSAQHRLNAFYAAKKLRVAKAELAEIKERQELVGNLLSSVIGFASKGAMGVAASLVTAASSANSHGASSGSHETNSGIVEGAEDIGEFGGEHIGELLGGVPFGRRAQEAEALVARLKGVLASERENELKKTFKSVQTQLSASLTILSGLAALSDVYNNERQARATAFGSTAVDALVDSTVRSHRRRDPFSTRNRAGKQRAQAALGGLADYERVNAVAMAHEWPDIDGAIPLATFLRSSGFDDGPDYVMRMAIEASKLRWWRERILQVRAVGGTLRESIHTMVNNAGKSPR